MLGTAPNGDVGRGSGECLAGCRMLRLSPFTQGPPSLSERKPSIQPDLLG